MGSKLFLLSALSAQLADAIVTRAIPCGFRIWAVDETGVSLPIGEIQSGQCRAGGQMDSSLFTWFGDAFVDQLGRGCWWTPPTSVLQCDEGQEPGHGFDIDCDGKLYYSRQSSFWQCQTGESGQVNIYMNPGGANCTEITIMADNCRSDCASGGGNGPSPAPSSSALLTPTGPLTPTPFTTLTSTPSSPASSTSSSSFPSISPCSANGLISDLAAGAWEFPHMMVAIDAAAPARAYGPTFFGQVSPNASTIFNFDMPNAAAGKTCTLMFALPSRAPPSPPSNSSSGSRGADYTLTGTGDVEFVYLATGATALTSYASAPLVRALAGTLHLEAPASGSGSQFYVVRSFQCPAGRRLSFAMREPGGSDTCLVYLQTYDPTPAGLFIATC